MFDAYEKTALSEIIEFIRDDRDTKDIVRQIRSAFLSADRDNLKKNLMVFRPALEDTDKASGIAQFDIDEYDRAKSIELKNKLISECENLLYAFLSPSNGLKFGIATDFSSDQTDIIEIKYGLAYDVVSKHLKEEIGIDAVDFDNKVRPISQLCYFSHDEKAYLNVSAKRLILNEKVSDLYRKQQEKEKQSVIAAFSKNQTSYSKTDPDLVLKALAHITKDYGFDKRLPVNAAILKEFGSSRGKSILLDHWNTADRKELTRQIDSQAKSVAKGSLNNGLGVVFSEAKKNGFQSGEFLSANRVGVAQGNSPTYLDEEYFTAQDVDREIGASVDSFLENDENMCLLIEAGAGKTRKTLERLVQAYKKSNGKLKIAFFVPDHKLAGQIKKSFQGDKNLGTDAVYGENSLVKKLKNTFGVENVSVIEGYQRSCNLLSDDERKNDSLSGKVMLDENVCKGCIYLQHYLEREKEYCNYRKQYNRLGNIRVYTHSHLFNRTKKLDNFTPDVIVIDEDIVGRATSNITEIYRRTGHKLFKDIIADLKNGKLIPEILKEKSEEVKSLYKQLAMENKEALVRAREDSGGEKFNRFHNERKAFRAVKILREYYKFHHDNENRDYEKPASNIWVNCHYKKGDYLALGQLDKIDESWNSAKFLYLDASGSEAIIQNVFAEKDFKIKRIRCRYNDNVHITQICNSSLARKKLESTSRQKSITELVESADKDTAFISYKHTDKIKKENYILDALDGDESRFLYFGNLRGINVFEDKRKLVVIGRQCLGDETLYDKAQVIFGGGDLNLDVSTKKNQLPKTVRMKDGKHLSFEDYEYSDPRMLECSEHFEKAELYQAVHRLRLVHGNDHKEVVLLTNQVCDIWVDELVGYKEVLSEGSINFIQKHLRDKGAFLIKRWQKHERLFGEKADTIARAEARHRSELENDPNLELRKLNIHDLDKGKDDTVEVYVNTTFDSDVMIQNLEKDFALKVL